MRLIAALALVILIPTISLAGPRSRGGGCGPGGCGSGQSAQFVPQAQFQYVTPYQNATPYQNYYEVVRETPQAPTPAAPTPVDSAADRLAAACQTAPVDRLILASRSKK